jgi:hypothetical protein
MQHSLENPPNPFDEPDCPCPLIAVQGLRAGYLQLSQPQGVMRYQDLSEALFVAARDWSKRLENLGARRVYWLMLSDVVRQLHWHLYPQWPEDTQAGLVLFEARQTLPQPSWNLSLATALADWSRAHQVRIKKPD